MCTRLKSPKGEPIYHPVGLLLLQLEPQIADSPGIMLQIHDILWQMTERYMRAVLIVASHTNAPV